MARRSLAMLSAWPGRPAIQEVGSGSGPSPGSEPGPGDHPVLRARAAAGVTAGKVPGVALRLDELDWQRGWLCGWRNVTASTNERTAIPAAGAEDTWTRSRQSPLEQLGGMGKLRPGTFRPVPGAGKIPRRGWTHAHLRPPDRRLSISALAGMGRPHRTNASRRGLACCHNIGCPLLFSVDCGRWDRYVAGG
jgi:hypothetical protein